MNNNKKTTIYDLKYLIIPDFIYKLDLGGIEIKVAGFIYSFNGEYFYFSNSQLAEMFNCSKKTITRAISKLQEVGLIKAHYEIKSGGGKIRFIEKTFDENKEEIGRDKNVPSEGTKMSRQKGQKCPVYIKDNKIKDNKINNIILHSKEDFAGRDINNLISLFKEINPSYYSLYDNKTQRKALERLVSRFGLEKVEATIKALPQIIYQPYAPRITTPLELEKNLAKLIAFVKQEKNKKVGKLVIIE